MQQQLRNQLQQELLRRELARRDYLAFIQYLRPDFSTGPFQIHLAAVLQNFVRAILRRESPFLVLQAPPRHGKSLQVSEYLAPFFFLHEPTGQYIHTSYNQSLSDNFGRLVRRTLNSPIYQELAPQASPDPNTNAIARIDTISGGQYSAVGMGGTLAGLGAHLLAIDDPIKNEEEAKSPKVLEDHWNWYLSVARTRLMPGGGIVLVTTRWSHADLAGKVVEQSRSSPRADQFKTYSYPALCTDPTQDLLKRKMDEPLDPLRYDFEALSRLRATLSPRAWSALFQQAPVPDEGSFFQIADIEKAITPLAEYPHTEDMYIYLPVDFAIGQRQSNDYTVMWPFGVDEDNEIWFLPDLVRDKITGHPCIEKLLDLADRLSPREIIPEDGHLYRALDDFIKNRMRERGKSHYLNPVWPAKDKTTRAEPLRACVQQGRVHFPDIPLVREVFLQEAASFGVDNAGIHDDMVDAAAIGVARVSNLRSPGHPAQDTTPDGPEMYTYEWLQQQAGTRRRGDPNAGRRNPRLKVPRRLNGTERD